MKRGREGEDEAETAGTSLENNNNAKKRDVYGISFMKEKKVVVEEKGCFKAWDSTNLALGVFDFPWLKDGVMSKSEEGCFLDCEDSFLSSLERQDTSFKADGIDFCEEQGLCDAPEGSMAHIPEDKLVEDLWQPFGSDGLELQATEDVDCIWSFLLNKPL